MEILDRGWGEGHLQDQEQGRGTAELVAVVTGWKVSDEVTSLDPLLKYFAVVGVPTEKHL